MSRYKILIFGKILLGLDFMFFIIVLFFLFLSLMKRKSENPSVKTFIFWQKVSSNRSDSIFLHLTKSFYQYETLQRIQLGPLSCRKIQRLTLY